MRLIVITDNKMISLGMFAKDIFSDIVLTVDKTVVFNILCQHQISPKILS